MGVLSGEGGAVNGESTVRDWEIDDRTDPTEIVTSNTANAVYPGCGVSDWTGFYNAYAHTSNVFPGDNFTFTGNINGLKGATGTAICDLITVTADIENGRYVESRTQFSGNGTLTHGSAAATDSGIPDPPCSRGLGIKLDGASIGEVAFWQFAIQARNTSRVTSSTNGQRRRIKGPITGQFQYKFYYDDPAVLPTKGSIYVVDFEVTAAAAWQWSWGKIVRVVPTWNRESREPPYATVYGIFHPYSGTGQGWIKNPAGTTKWPA